MHKFLQTARDRALVIVERERPFFTPGALSMYVLALVAEAPVIIARYVLALLVVFAVLVIEGNPHGGTEWALVALIPTAWSALALFNPTGGGWWWQTRAGGREPSKREQLAYQDAVEVLQNNTSRPLPLPAHWFVLDSPQPDAAVCGDTLMLSRGLLETNRLPAVLAHELGHLASPDARLTAAINRGIGPGGRARGLPRDPRPDPLQPNPIPLAHPAHPPTNRAQNRPPPVKDPGNHRRRARGRGVAPGSAYVKDGSPPLF